MDLIEISSSDSDFDMDNEPEIVSSSSMVSHAPAHGRRLPSWASALGPDLRDEGYGGKKRASSPKKIPSNRETSSYATFRSRIDPDPDSSKCGHIQAPSSSIYSHSDVSGVKACNLQSSEEDDNRHLSTTNQSVRRSLPASFQHSLVHYKKNNSRYNVGNSHSNGWSYSSTALGLNDGRRYAEDSVARDGGDDVIMLDHKGSRILPPSLMRGRPVSATNSAALSDPVHHLGLGEEGVAGNERLIFQSALQDLNQPKIEADIPDGILSVPLLRHQKIALAWMLQKESRTTHCVGGILADDQGLGKTISTIALIQMQRSMQSKSDSVQQDHETEALNLDDDDDNNVASSENTKECAVDNGVASLEKLKQEPDGIECSPGRSSSKRTFRGQRPAAGTLIVCPATVLRQWERELKDKVTDEAKLSVLVYHGGNRTKDPSELAKHDVVLTTYSIVTNEVPKQPLAGEDDADKTGEDYGLSSEFSINKRNKRPSGTTKKGKKSRKEKDAVLMDSGSGTLARVSWFRVVLDEAQCIKNYRTQAARACCGLRAKRRWCLSGTPIQNAIDELYSYFRFLRYEPYSSYKAFSEGIKIPISRDSKYGYKKLQAILKTLLLRRTKDTLLDGQPIISLPPKFIEMKRVSFTGEERSFYAKLEAESRSQFKAYAAAGTLNQNYANILLMLLRLRQACDHPFLVKGLTSESVHRTNLEKAKQLPKHTLIDLFTHLDASTAICQICRDPAEDAVITMCSHVFCYQCVSEHLNGDDNLCPASRCRKHISADVLFSKSTLRCCLSDEVEGNLSNGDPSYQSLSIMKEEYISSKIKAALQVLKSSCKFSSPYMDQDDFGESDLVDLEVRTDMTDCSSWEGPTKAIVFSQWTTMLNLFQSFLQRYCIPYRRLDGTMSLAARDKAVREFNSDPEVIVMLMSLKAGNLGLNMVAACHVILLDLWWNPTTEDQAVDRAHRIGQTRPVTISRITIKDTVEDRILALQEEKRKMVASAFGEDHSGGSATRLTVEDLRYLFLGNP